jgi:hypothetical protein
LHIFEEGLKRFLTRLLKTEAISQWALGLNLEIPSKTDE